MIARFCIVAVILSALKASAQIDALNWTESRTGFTNYNLNAVIFDGDRFLASGNSPGNHSIVLSSPNGQTWQEESSLFGASLVGLAYGNGKYAALDFFGKILWSNDARDWSAVEPIQTTNCVQNLRFRKIVFGQGKFVAIADASYCNSTADGWIVSSSDAIHWDLVARPVNVEDIVYGSNIFTCVGQGIVNVHVSTDGIRWTSYNSHVFGGFNAVGVGRGLLVAFADFIYLSEDGVHWAAGERPQFSVRSILYVGNRFLAAGISPQNGGVVFVSNDGKAWQKDSLEATNFVQSACFGKGTFILVGEAGTTWSSPATSGSSVTELVINHAVEITFKSEIGARYQLQSSDDLQRWSDQGVSLLASSAQTSTFVKTDAKAKYFRAVKLLAI